MTTETFVHDEFPYNHAGETLEFEVGSYHRDTNAETELDEASDRQLALFDDPNADNWDTLSIDISITIERDTLEEVFPDPDDHEGIIIVSGYCNATHERFFEPVMWNNFDADTFETTLELDREDFRERIQLTPRLVRRTTRAGNDGYADGAGRELATGPPFEVYIDEPLLNLNGDLPVEAAKFSERQDLGSEGNEWYVDIRDPEAPKLWVNKDHPHVVNVIKSVDEQTKRGRVGRVVLNHLAVSMLTQFTIKAAQYAVVTGDIEHRWQDTLLTDVCQEYFGMNPSIKELEQLLSPEAIPDTLNAIESIIQRRRAPQDDVRSLVQVIGDD
jgi:hypothetical protein